MPPLLGSADRPERAKADSANLDQTTGSRSNAPADPTAATLGSNPANPSSARNQVASLLGRNVMKSPQKVRLANPAASTHLNLTVARLTECQAGNRRQRRKVIVGKECRQGMLKADSQGTPRSPIPQVGSKNRLSTAIALELHGVKRPRTEAGNHSRSGPLQLACVSDRNGDSEHNWATI